LAFGRVEARASVAFAGWAAGATTIIGPSLSDGSVACATGSDACVPRMRNPAARPNNQLPKFDRFIASTPRQKTEANG
jgi:hypothetical protein